VRSGTSRGGAHELGPSSIGIDRDEADVLLARERVVNSLEVVDTMESKRRGRDVRIHPTGCGERAGTVVAG
jgi:hypothetical protein